MDAVTGATILLVVAVTFAVTVYVSIFAHLREMRKHSSRFPLFAVRDHLVLLVTTGVMHEKNKAWQAIYYTVNAMLGMHEKHTVTSFTLSYIRSSVAISRNPKRKAAAEKMGASIDAEAKKHPEFAAVLDELEFAYGYLIGQRSKRWHVWVLRSALLTFAVTMYGLAFLFRLIVLRPKKVAESASDLAAWQSCPR